MRGWTPLEKFTHKTNLASLRFTAIEQNQRIKLPRPYTPRHPLEKIGKMLRRAYRWTTTREAAPIHLQRQSRQVTPPNHPLWRYLLTLRDIANDVRQELPEAAGIISRARRIIVFVGAGISTNCGIPVSIDMHLRLS